MDGKVVGVHLRRAEEHGTAIDALDSLLGGRVGLPALLADLDRRGRRAWTRPFWPPGRAVHRALTWDRADRRTEQWWPQGISSSADASDSEEVQGHRLLAVTWYAKDVGEGSQGSRVTFVDLENRRYRHVLLVEPRVRRDGSLELQPLRVHAGGLVWCGDYLHVAATARGFMTFRLDDLMRVPDERSGRADACGIDGDRVSSYGYRYLLPVRHVYEGVAEEGHEKLRYSFLSLDRAASPPRLVAGEYATAKGGTRRLVHYALDPESLLPQAGADGISRPLLLESDGMAHSQGAVVAKGIYYVSASAGRYRPGSIYVGRPGAFRRFSQVTPMGPEDITWWPSTDVLWSVTEHPGRRWVFCMRRTWFDG
jgi:hypothetical protein